MEVYKVKAKDILTYNLVPWIGQRGLNMDWVSELKKRQYYYISTSKAYAIIPGSLIIVKYNDIMYLVDGHRTLTSTPINALNPRIQRIN